jgi:hypothetical protein
MIMAVKTDAKIEVHTVNIPEDNALYIKITSKIIFENELT